MQINHRSGYCIAHSLRNVRYLHEIMKLKKKTKKKVVTFLLEKVTVVLKPSTCIIPRAVDCSKGLIAGILPVLLFGLFDCASNYNHPLFSWYFRYRESWLLSLP